MSTLNQPHIIIAKYLQKPDKLNAIFRNIGLLFRYQQLFTNDEIVVTQIKYVDLFFSTLEVT